MGFTFIDAPGNPDRDLEEKATAKIRKCYTFTSSPNGSTDGLLPPAGANQFTGSSNTVNSAKHTTEPESSLVSHRGA